jgi:antitoxin component YwqK of YwqJK toxin-antitoxin module
MKYSFFFILTLVQSAISFSQTGKQTKLKCYEDSIDFEGYIVSDCGRKKGVISFDDKLMTDPGNNAILWNHNKQPFSGECESCYSVNEKTYFRFKVESGQINGQYLVNHPSGCIQERGTKIMGKFDGRIELFYDSTNAIKEISNYVLGKMAGEQLFLKANGDTISFENYKVVTKGEQIESLLHGVQRMYFSNGKMESEINYNTGLLEGDYKKYTKDGTLINDRKFKKGKEAGKCISYYDNGKKMFEETWKDGIKDGDFIFYLPNDSIKFEEHYKKGIPEGTFKEYYENRQLQSLVVYVKGKVVSEKYWNEYGQEITKDGTKVMEAPSEKDSESSPKKSEKKSVDTKPKTEKKGKEEKPKAAEKKKTKELPPPEEKEEEEL